MKIEGGYDCDVYFLEVYDRKSKTYTCEIEAKDGEYTHDLITMSDSEVDDLIELLTKIKEKRL